MVEGAVSEQGKGYVFYLVFPAGAKPGEFVVCLHPTEDNLEALLGLFWQNAYCFMPCLVCWNIAVPL